MNRIDPFQLSRPKREARTFELDDPDHKGVKYTFVLRSKDMLDLHRQEDRAQELVRKYITGDGEDEPVSFTAIDGELVEVSESLFRWVAGIEVMQCPDVAENRYSAEQLVAIAVVSPKVWTKLISECGALQDSFEAQKKIEREENIEASSEATSVN